MNAPTNLLQLFRSFRSTFGLAAFAGLLVASDSKLKTNVFR